MLQDCTVRPCTHEILPVPEPEFPVAGIEPVASFEITLDGDTSFGNPQFEV
jgi:hypothetical protein